MGKGNVPAALPTVDDGSSSLAAERAGEGKVRVDLPGNDLGIEKSGIVGAQEMDTVGCEGTGTGKGPKMGEGNVPAAVPGVDDGSSSLVASRVVPGNDSGIGKSGTVGA